MSTSETEIPGTYGLERWVQFAFVLSALVLFWFFDHIIAAVWSIFDDPNSQVVTISAVLLAVMGAVGLYKSDKVNNFVNHVAQELVKVTWPTRQETYVQTGIVLVISVIAAVIFGVFDASWARVTAMIYGVAS